MEQLSIGRAIYLECKIIHFFLSFLKLEISATHFKWHLIVFVNAAI